MTITTENMGEILQRIYDSEIDIAMAWIWDGGFVYAVENNPYPLEKSYKKENITYTGDGKLVNGFTTMVKDILEKYPNSTFAKWFDSSRLEGTNN